MKPVWFKNPTARSWYLTDLRSLLSGRRAQYDHPMSNNFVRAGNLDADFDIDSGAGKIRVHGALTGTGAPVAPPDVIEKVWVYFDYSTSPASVYFWEPDGETWNPAGVVAETSHSVVLIVCGPTEPAIVSDGVLYFTVPPQLDGYSITSVAATLPGGASNTGGLLIQIARRRGGTTVDTLSTRISIDEAESSSSTAAVPAVVNGANASLQTGDILRVDVDAAGVDAFGLQVIVTADLP
jgi:hypothetical protein